MVSITKEMMEQYVIWPAVHVYSVNIIVSLMASHLVKSAYACTLQACQDVSFG